MKILLHKTAKYYLYGVESYENMDLDLIIILAEKYMQCCSKKCGVFSRGRPICNLASCIKPRSVN